MVDEIKTTRKIYSRDILLDLFYYPTDIPKYLLAFPELLIESIDDLWCKKPLPKFEEVAETYRHKANYIPNKYKGRQRTTSSQSIENSNEAEINPKYKSSIKFKADKYNRYNLLNESQLNTIVNAEIIEDGESSWKTVESKPYKVSSLSKQYVSNYQGQENHWKKWGKDRTLSGDKTTFGGNEKTNNFIVRKAKPEIKLDTKVHTSQSFSAGTDQTEDIWQDDWDTEMQSQIATTPPTESLDFYELPPSSVNMSSAVEDQRGRISTPSNDIHNSNTDYNLWFYKDLSDNIQGPFLSDSMANWLATGYFDYSTCLRRKCDEKFLLLAEYRALYGRIPFTMGHTIEPILKDTTVEIDPIQLAVGVDRNILQKVLTNATSLSSKISPLLKSNMTSPDNCNNILLTNELEKQALLEEKRKFEESKAELERERQRMLEEQEQWKIRMEQEMVLKMQSLLEQQSKEFTKTQPDAEIRSMNEITDETQAIKTIMQEQSKPNIYVDMIVTPVIREQNDKVLTNPARSITKGEMILNLEELEGDDWLSTKDVKKDKKIRKTKIKQSPEIPVIVSTEIKKFDSDKIGQKETVQPYIIARETLEATKLEGFKMADAVPSHIWNLKPSITTAEPPKSSKSLLEIQAEESEKEKIKQEMEKTQHQLKIDGNKVTSFKESLLKNVKPVVTTPMIPPGKSIWDVADTVDNVSVPEPVAAKVVVVVEHKTMKKTTKKTSDNNNNDDSDDGLFSWCAGKLSKFKKDLDVLTLVDLLKQVPDEDVTELTVELLDDSLFSRNFAKDFIKKREDFRMCTSKDEDAWQTVKKSQNSVPVVVSNTTGGKKSKKKKMVVVDHQTKFRAS